MFLKSTGKRGLFDEQEAIDLMSEMGNSLDSWTKKGGDTFYGYKNHAKVDTKSKLIITWLQMPLCTTLSH